MRIMEKIRNFFLKTPVVNINEKFKSKLGIIPEKKE